MKKLLVFSVVALFLSAGLVSAANYVELFRCRCDKIEQSSYEFIEKFILSGANACDTGYSMDVNPGFGELGYLFSPEQGATMKGVLPLKVDSENIFTDKLSAQYSPEAKTLGYLYENKPACGDTAPLYLCKHKTVNNIAVATPDGYNLRSNYVSTSCDSSWSNTPKLLGYVLTGPQKAGCIPSEQLSDVRLQQPSSSPKTLPSTKSTLISKVKTSFKIATGNFVALFR